MRYPMKTLLPILLLALAALALGGGTAAAQNENPGQGDENRSVRVTGVLTDEGVECPALRGDDGQIYTLTPRDLQGFEVGDRVAVVGKVAEISFCQQGTTLEVQKITAAKPAL
ncbi:MAG TPA: DUF5818 domain-containing protein [Thermoanaerobaculia bacterium]|nr:DUF5818 domain-containing protein [Thermoanaerobaculia bacterium]